MARPPTPSRYILQKAWKLGQKMAHRDRRIRPNLEDVHQYTTYSLFKSVHRHHVESLDAFRPWEAKLDELIERAANSADAGLDESREWERYHNLLAQPIRAAFWYGWEQVHDLEKRYTQAVDLHLRNNAPSAVLSVRAGPTSPDVPSALPEGAELTLWEAVARKIFDELGLEADERFWQLPNPDHVIRRDTNGEPPRT